MKVNYMQLKSSKHCTIQIIIQASEKMKINLMGQGKNRNSQHLMKMMHHLAVNGMEIITVVHMMPYLQFCSIYGCQTLRSGKRYSKIPIRIYLHYIMDS